MGTVLPFIAVSRERGLAGDQPMGVGEVVIFPGVRIERHQDPDADQPTSGRGKLDGTNGRRRPRKST